MDWLGTYAPTLENMKRLAEAAYARLPEAFRARLDGLAILVEDFPDDETIDELGLETPFDLLGLYRGVELTRKSVSDVITVPDMVLLYRRPILDAWLEGEDALDELVTHVLVHEIGHHFGLSDEDMEALEATARPQRPS
jgi:predicted Zn-dependent protease with MMP-like domain